MSVTFTIQDIDLGWSATMRNLAGLDEMRVEAGLFEPEQAVKGARNELGTADIPSRPWLSVAADTNTGFAGSLAAQVLGQVADRKVTAAKALDSIGRLLKARTRGVIENQQVDGPPLAASTVARKGHDNKLIDTGAMLDAIDYEISKNGANDD